MSRFKSHPGKLFASTPPQWLKSGLYALLALICLILDQHQHRLEAFRQTLHVWTLPLQEIANLPMLTGHTLQQHLVTTEQLQRQNEVLQRRILQQADAVHQVQVLQRQLSQLRALINLKDSPQFPSHLCRVLGTPANPYIQKLRIEGGSQSIALGSPVLTDQGLLGQVTEVFPEESEVTLISNRDLTVPVEVERTGLRTLAVGSGYQGELWLPYVPSGTDLQKGDVLLTSGIDGLYPRGLTVGTVISVTRHRSTAFAEVKVHTNLGVDSYSLVLVTTPAHPTTPPE
ncbi:MAG: rod shape-determining protein MreC [Betaproteobacteria bacterium]|jgi:rod shape-determining protein MreC|nr:rod shape-determining protein MreC [Betaproteobacteria bacterium]